MKSPFGFLFEYKKYIYFFNYFQQACTKCICFVSQSFCFDLKKNPFKKFDDLIY